MCLNLMMQWRENQQRAKFSRSYEIANVTEKLKKFLKKISLPILLYVRVQQMLKDYHVKLTKKINKSLKFSKSVLFPKKSEKFVLELQTFGL